ncbi:SANT/Myb_domain [Hexamita inflata]|uniref:SANT/Myb domain n=1 Tax=Hexamita inflata TaxID=28002 RepID=A0AA86VK69_9EUKA|nr:SANT/Myb domain [Hexamita inflata]
MIKQCISHQLTENCCMLQKIHKLLHYLEEYQELHIKQKKYVHWTKEEDVLLENLQNLTGIYDHKIISAFIISKSPAQVYQRMRYLKERNNKQIVSKQ